jgi:hypothetical protein
MIRPEDQGSRRIPEVPPTAQEPGAQDFWAYVQDERQRYPRLWRVLVRIHTRAFRLAYPEYSLADVWKLGDNILRDAVTAIEALDDSSAEALGSNPGRFHLQMPVFPTEKQASDFSGTWRGWLTVGKPERVY